MEDWQRQSRSMSDIRGYSDLNLIAAHARDHIDGSSENRAIHSRDHAWCQIRSSQYLMTPSLYVLRYGQDIQRTSA